MSFEWLRRLFSPRSVQLTVDEPLQTHSFIGQEPDLVKELKPQEVSGYLASGSGD